MINEFACGVAVAPDNHKALADALQSMAGDKVALKSMGGKGKQLALDKFDRNILSAQFADFLMKVAKA